MVDSLLSRSACSRIFCQSSLVTKGIMGCSSLHEAQTFLQHNDVHVNQVKSQVGCRVAVDHTGLSALQDSQILPQFLCHKGHVRVKQAAGCRLQGLRQQDLSTTSFIQKGENRSLKLFSLTSLIMHA